MKDAPMPTTRTRPKRRLALLAVPIAALALYAAEASPRGAPEGATTATPKGVPAVKGLKGCPGDGRPGFSHSFLGPRFRGMKLSSVLRTCDQPSSRAARAAGEPDVARANLVSYVYGGCDVPEEGDNPGCYPPLSVSNAPACERNLSLYYRYPDVNGKPLSHRRLAIRGVPAASFFGGRQLEVYTADSTVTIEGEDPRLVRAAAYALRPGLSNLRVPLNQSRVGGGIDELKIALNEASVSQRKVATQSAPTGLLRRPVRGALAGKASC